MRPLRREVHAPPEASEPCYHCSCLSSRHATFQPSGADGVDRSVASGDTRLSPTMRGDDGHSRGRCHDPLSQNPRIPSDRRHGV